MSTNHRDESKVSKPSGQDFVRGMVAGYYNGLGSKSILLPLAAGFFIGKAIRRGRK